MLKCPAWRVVALNFFIIYPANDTNIASDLTDADTNYTLFNLGTKKYRVRKTVLKSKYEFIQTDLYKIRSPNERNFQNKQLRPLPSFDLKYLFRLLKQVQSIQEIENVHRSWCV